MVIRQSKAEGALVGKPALWKYLEHDNKFDGANDEWQREGVDRPES